MSRRITVRTVKLVPRSADMIVMQDRRSEVRMLCADMVHVRWRDEDGKSVRAMGLLEDISHSGACLQLEAPVPLAAKISWDSHKHRFRGEVRYCVYREVGYFVGVELEAGSRWSQESFKPRHLLDPQTLLRAANRGSTPGSPPGSTPSRNSPNTATIPRDVG